MKIKFKSPFTTAIAISFGLVVLLGYFFGTNAAGEPTTLGILRDFFFSIPAPPINTAPTTD